MRALVCLEEYLLWAFFLDLCRTFGGCVKLKNLFDLPEEERANRYHLLSIMATVLVTTGVTYGELVQDPAVQKAWAAHRSSPDPIEPLTRWHKIVDGAIEYLSSPELRDVEVKMLGEVQLMPSAYVHTRQRMHEVYRVDRAADTVALWNDMRRSSPFVSAPPVHGGSPGQQPSVYDIVMGGNTTAVQQLLDAGTLDPNTAVSPSGYSNGVHLACRNGMADVLELLIDARGDVAMPTFHDDGEETFPLGLAAQEGHLDVCQLLIRRGADVNQTVGGYTALRYAKQYEFRDIIELLTKAGATC